MAETNGRASPAWIGYAFAAIIALDIGFTAWLSVRWIETETTQNSVTSDIQTLKNVVIELKRLLSDVHEKITNLPRSIDDDDRWYRDLEMEYQKRIDVEIRHLQKQIDDNKQQIEGK